MKFEIKKDTCGYRSYCERVQAARQRMVYISKYLSSFAISPHISKVRIIPSASITTV